MWSTVKLMSKYVEHVKEREGWNIYHMLLSYRYSMVETSQAQGIQLVM